MQEDIIRSILSRYDIIDKEQVDQALQCIKFPQNWEKFIKQWINQENYEQFLLQLSNAEIISAPQANNRKQTLIEIYQNINPVQINLSAINVLHTNHYKWSKNLIEDVQIKIKEKIAKNIIDQNFLSEFLMKKQSIEHIFDLILSKGDLKDYFDELRQAMKNNIQLKNFTFLDFVILLAKVIKQKQILGSELSSLAIPIPFAYQIKDKVIIDTQLFRNILSQNNYSLIINIGSQKAAKCGKTSLIAKLMSLEEKYIQSSHFQNLINFFTKLSFTQEGLPAILADFNGAFSKDLHPKLLKLILNLAKNSSLIIIHLKKQQLQEKLLQRPQYIQLCKHVAKILIYVRDIQKSSLKALKSHIPQNIREKSFLRIIKNGQEHPIDYKQQIEFICEASLNKANKYFSMGQIYDPQDRLRIQQDQNTVEQAIKMLQVYSKQQIIPCICKKQKICQLHQRMQQESRYENKVFKYSQQIMKLEDEVPILTSFMNKFLEILKNGQYCQQRFVGRLNEWKKKKSQPLRQEYLFLTKKIEQNQKNSNIYREKLYLNLEKRDNLEISIDKFINQLILFLEQKEYKEQFKKLNLFNLVTRFYQQNIKRVYPINIVDGKTLQFGSNTLQQQMRNISQRYKNKRIYVVSVIGAQSSAKSTLLNFLFRCNFETSEGRCTKGVYMSICEMEDMVVVVLDTEGLLSVSERDIAFDHQIATFILKTSNIIIINNKGELTSTLRNMIEVCAYVLKCLHKDENTKVLKPQKIIFALRDQRQPEKNFQQEMAAQITHSLQKMKSTSSLDFREFFSIEPEDILCFPNAFVQKEGLISKTGSISLYNSTFQKCIMGMRKRIVDLLRDSTPKVDLSHFYKEASTSWDTIRECGKNIMNYRYIHEAITKRNLSRIFQDIIQYCLSKMEANHTHLFQKIEIIESSKQIQNGQYDKQLQEICRTNCEEMTQYFQEKCEQACSNQEWIKQFRPYIERICQSYKFLNLQNLQKLIKKVKRRQKENILKDRLSIIIKNVVKQNKTIEEVLQKFQLDTAQLKKEQDNLEINRIDKNKFEIELKEVFSNMLAVYKNQELKINTITKCVSFVKEIEQGSNINKLLNNKHQNNYNQVILNELLQKMGKKFTKKVKNILHQRDISAPCKIFNSFGPFFEIINNIIGVLFKKLHQLNYHKNCNLQLNALQIQRYLFGKAFLICKRQIIQIIRKNSLNEKRLVLDKIQEFKKQLMQIIRNKESLNYLIKNDVNRFARNHISSKQRQFAQMVQSQIENVSIKLRPQVIFRKAMKETLASRNIQNSKQYYVKCYKVVTNINRFLFQKMCQYPQISNRQSIIAEGKEKVLKLAQEKITKTINAIKVMNSVPQKSNVKKVLIENQMIMAANFESQNFSMDLICQKILNQLTNRRQKISEDLAKCLKSTNSEKLIIKYIETTLREKIIGCQHCCPICGMKCMLSSGHEEGHHVLQNCHSLSAFAGVHKVNTKQFVLDICQGSDNMLCRWKYGEQIYDNLQIYINKFYPEWKDDFPKVSETYKFQNVLNIVKLKRIWINIQSLMLKRWNSLAPCSNSSVQQLKDENELKEEDLNTEFIHPLTKTIYTLKDYKQNSLSFEDEQLQEHKFSSHQYHQQQYYECDDNDNYQDHFYRKQQKKQENYEQNSDEDNSFQW